MTSSYVTIEEEPLLTSSKAEASPKKWPRAAVLAVVATVGFIAGCAATSSFSPAPGRTEPRTTELRVGRPAVQREAAPSCPDCPDCPAVKQDIAVKAAPKCTGSNPPSECMSATEVARVVNALGVTDGRIEFCLSAVAVAFGESAAFDNQNSPNGQFSCPGATPRCLDSKARNENNDQVHGLWQLMIGGTGTPTQQAQSMLTNYAGRGFCTLPPGAPGFWPQPELLVPIDPLGTLVAERMPHWRFCKGAWTGDNPHPSGKGPDYYAQFTIAAQTACNAAFANP